MTDPLFFDTDCISAFLWVGEESLLPKLYPKRLVLPRPVYVELSHPAVSNLKTRIDIMISARLIEIAEIFVGTEEYDQYYRLTTAPEPGHKLIGKGEASSIALAKVKGVVVASNNLADILVYIQEFQLEHITTGMIMKAAFEQGLLSEMEANVIWALMLGKRRKLGAASFTEYLKR